MCCGTLQTIFSSWSSAIDEGNPTTSTHSRRIVPLHDRRLNFERGRQINGPRGASIKYSLQIMIYRKSSFLYKVKKEYKNKLDR